MKKIIERKTKNRSRVVVEEVNGSGIVKQLVELVKILLSSHKHSS